MSREFKSAFATTVQPSNTAASTAPRQQAWASSWGATKAAVPPAQFDDEKGAPVGAPSPPAPAASTAKQQSAFFQTAFQARQQPIVPTQRLQQPVATTVDAARDPAAASVAATSPGSADDATALSPAVPVVSSAPLLPTPSRPTVAEEAAASTTPPAAATAAAAAAAAAPGVALGEPPAASDITESASTTTAAAPNEAPLASGAAAVPQATPPRAPPTAPVPSAVQAPVNAAAFKSAFATPVKATPAPGAQAAAPAFKSAFVKVATSDDSTPAVAKAASAFASVAASAPAAATVARPTPAASREAVQTTTPPPPPPPARAPKAPTPPPPPPPAVVDPIALAAEQFARDQAAALLAWFLHGEEKARQALYLEWNLSLGAAVRGAMEATSLMIASETEVAVAKIAKVATAFRATTVASEELRAGIVRATASLDDVGRQIQQCESSIAAAVQRTTTLETTTADADARHALVEEARFVLRLESADRRDALQRFAQKRLLRA